MKREKVDVGFRKHYIGKAEEIGLRKQERQTENWKREHEDTETSLSQRIIQISEARF